MGFSAEVRDKALIACNRCCCICHKFCGKKIELHHIQQKADGGDDSFDNCIPLCFDCHADMGKTDPHHPKGKQYSARELIGHRDNWYQKVKNSITSRNVQVCDEDKKLFEKICSIFNKEIQFYLSEVDLAGSHPKDIFDPLYELMHENKDPSFSFINVELESMKATLIDVVNKFLNHLSLHTFLIGPKKPYNATHLWLANHGYIPFPDKETYAQFHEDAKTLDELATSVWKSYCTFVKDGRRIINS
jgi:hypothetical protein